VGEDGGGGGGVDGGECREPISGGKGFNDFPFSSVIDPTASDKMSTRTKGGTKLGRPPKAVWVRTRKEEVEGVGEGRKEAEVAAWDGRRQGRWRGRKKAGRIPHQIIRGEVVEEG